MPTNDDDDQGVDGTDTVSFRAFLKDLTFNEVHLAWMGLYAGFVAVRPRRRQEPTQAMKEKLNWSGNAWYFQTMYVAGYTLKAVLVGGIAVRPEMLLGLLPA